MTLSVAYYTNDTSVKNTILKSDAVRRKALANCYKITGYANLTLDGKNKLYDEAVLNLL